MTENETPIIPTHEFAEESDMQKFRERPADACEGMQKKYLGQTYQEFLISWNALKDHK
jgi:hypothetical protein